MANHEGIITDFMALPDAAKPAAVDWMEVVASVLPPEPLLRQMTTILNPGAYTIEVILGTGARLFAQELDPQGYNPSTFDVQTDFYHMLQGHTAEEMREAVTVLRDQGYNMPVIVTD